MKNKKKTYISIGVFLSIIAFVWSVVSAPAGKIETIDIVDQIKIIFNVTVTFTVLGISESFFIKSGIVSKWIRYIIYWQWIVVPIVLIITIVDIL